MALAGASLALFVAACGSLLNVSGVQVNPWWQFVTGFLIAGPGAGLVAGVTVLGSGWTRFAAIPVVVILVVVVEVLVVKVVSPIQKASAVT